MSNEKALTDQLTLCFLELEKQYLNAAGAGGTTVTAALIFENKTYVISIGDSQTVLFREGAGFQLSEDADVSNSGFAHAAKKQGIFIYSGRVYGQLGVARNFGVLAPCRPKITRIVQDGPDAFTEDTPY